MEVIRAADPDVFSLVECDEYEAFWRGRLEELGYGSVWHKRPRASAPDGCCLGFRERDWALDAHRTVSYDDHDRAALMGVLRRKDTGERFVFVSTHLARNPESLKQQGVRLRQVAQLRFGAPDLVQQVREQVGLQRRHAVVPRRHGAPLRYIKQ